MPSPTQTHRSAGVILFLVGCAVAIGQFIGFQQTGSIFAYLIAIPLVLIPSGLYMIATGKNPFEKLKR